MPPNNVTEYKKNAESLYRPIDPFKPSIAFSLKHLFSSRHEETTIDHIPVRSHLPPHLIPARPAWRSSSAPRRRPRITGRVYESAGSFERDRRQTTPSRRRRSSEGSEDSLASSPASRSSRHRSVSRSRSRSPRRWSNPASAPRPVVAPQPTVIIPPSPSIPTPVSRAGSDSSPRESVHEGLEDERSASSAPLDLEFDTTPSPTSSLRSVRRGRRGRSTSSARSSISPPVLIIAQPPAQAPPPVLQPLPFIERDDQPPVARPYSRRSRSRSPSRPLMPIIIPPVQISAISPSVEPSQSRPPIVVPPPVTVFPFPGMRRPDDPGNPAIEGCVSLGSEYADPEETTKPSLQAYVLAFAVDTLPRQMYLHLLLRLPYLYFSRVTRIFEEAEMSMPQIKECVMEAATATKSPQELAMAFGHNPPVRSPSFESLQNTWHSFIDSLMREWKTLNIISVLLLSAILTILQIDSAANDPLTRYAALLSMMCALMSLIYGCIYIIRFGAVRKAYKAAEWAHEAQKTKTGILWNVWVLLAMPATWLAWSMILYVVCIMSFVWRTGTIDDAERGLPTYHEVLAPRIVITVVLFFGITYFVLITNTLRRYGESMDRAWQRRIMQWLGDGVPQAHSVHTSSAPSDYKYNPLVQPYSRISTPHSFKFVATLPPAPSICKELAPSLSSTPVVNVESQTGPDIKMTRLLTLPPSEPTSALNDEPFGFGDEGLTATQIPEEKKDLFVSDIREAWDPTKPDRVFRTLSSWNNEFFYPRDGQVALCREYDASDVTMHALYHFSTREQLPPSARRYPPILDNLKRVDIIPLYADGLARLDQVNLFGKDHYPLSDGNWVPPSYHHDESDRDSADVNHEKDAHTSTSHEPVASWSPALVLQPAATRSSLSS
ncbi:unnamed protein product [Cyclocybe aegerita]|uniref:Uncharacterized protein n=1 Tax=Cyclocybe aegerita TaxID=1973307 RepID=A0A8S0VUM8_CYCAE|nr:unnamed protein product [Cyclocybe aegerita]